MNKKVNKILIASILIINSLTCYSQAIDSLQSKKHGVGLNADMTTGVGLSYRYMGKKFGVQLSFFPIYTMDERLFLLQGLSLNYKFLDKKQFDFFAYAGSAFLFRRSEETSTYELWGTGYAPTIETKEWVSKSYLFTSGIGTGVNFKGKGSFDWTIRMGFIYFSNFHSDFGILPAVGFGTYYSF